MDLEFKSPQHVLEEVRAMRVRGGSPFGRAAATAFLLVARNGKYDSTESLLGALDEIADALMAEKPSMATIYNARVMIVDSVKQGMASASKEEAAKEVIRRAERFIEWSREAVDKLSRVGANLVRDGDIIMMHSFSTSLMGIFRRAREAGRQFSVICTESRPLRESRYAVNTLVELGIPVTYVTDASAWEFLRKSNWVIVGADTITYDGSVTNKMGTAMIARLCASTQIPIYCASEILKLDPRTKNGYKPVLEIRPAEEVVSRDDFASFEGVSVINQFFDITPAKDITALITDRGVVPPSQCGLLWEELAKEIGRR
jgi:eIF-2B alpha/beta/delta-like uncharacterized protein